MNPLSPLILGLALSAAAASQAQGAQADSLEQASGGHPVAPIAVPFPQDLRIYGEGMGGEWVLGNNYKARANPHGFAFFPALEAGAEHHYPVEFRLRQVTSKDQAFPLTEEAVVTRQGHRFTLDRGEVRVTYDIEPDSVEQSFVFDRVAGMTSDLVLDLEVVTELKLGLDGAGFLFEGPFGGVRYGAAVAIDGRGRKVHVPMESTAEGLALRVPGSFLRRAVDPVIVDPILTTYGLSSFLTEIGDTDVAYDLTTDSFTYVYEIPVSNFDSDIVYRTTNSVGTFVAEGPINLDTENWIRPRAAGLNGDDCILICAIRTDLIDKDVVCKRLDMASNGLSAEQVVYSTGNNSSISYDVGGNASSAPGGVFLVPCSLGFYGPSGVLGGEMHVQRVDPLLNVTSSGPIESANLIFFDDVAISKSGGDPNTVSTWSVVYNATNAIGGTTLRGVQLNGNGGTLSAPYELYDFQSPGFAASLDVSDALDLGGLDPTYLVAMDRSVPGGSDLDVEIFVCRGDTRLSRIDLTQQEHADQARLQRNPRLSTTAEDFLVTYFEFDGSVWTPYLTALDLLFGTSVSISERRTQLGPGVTNPRRGAPAIASRFSGGMLTSRYSGIITPSVAPATGLATPLGVTHFANNGEATGLQFCTGTENSTGDRGFLAMYGQSDPLTPKSLVASALPAQSFGYMNSATMVGNVPGAGGSAGVLCIGGVIGRYTNQVLSSGSNGVITTALNPQAIPSGPGNIAAMAGQAWVFQLWHRDLVAGVQTSNFTNALIWLVE